MNKKQWKKLYSEYRWGIRDFNLRMTYSDWPCGYDDMMGENMRDATKRHLEANPVLKRVLDLLDKTDFLFGYTAITDGFRDYRYQNSFEHKGKLVIIQRSKP